MSYIAPLVGPAMTVLGAIITWLIAVYVPKALDAFQARTGIQLTELQRQAMLGAVATAAGVLETELDKRVLNITHIAASNSAVRTQAQLAISAVPEAAAALNMTVDGVSRMIVGAVNTRLPGVAASPSAPPMKVVPS